MSEATSSPTGPDYQSSSALIAFQLLLRLDSAARLNQTSSNSTVFEVYHWIKLPRSRINRKFRSARVTVVQQCGGISDAYPADPLRCFTRPCGCGRGRADLRLSPSLDVDCRIDVDACACACLEKTPSGLTTNLKPSGFMDLVQV